MIKVIVYTALIYTMVSCSGKKEMTPDQMKEDASKIELRVNKLDNEIDSLANSVK